LLESLKSVKKLHKQFKNFKVILESNKKVAHLNYSSVVSTVH